MDIPFTINRVKLPKELIYSQFEEDSAPEQKDDDYELIQTKKIESAPKPEPKPKVEDPILKLGMDNIDLDSIYKDVEKTYNRDHLDRIDDDLRSEKSFRGSSKRRPIRNRPTNGGQSLFNTLSEHKGKIIIACALLLFGMKQ
jgi:hypothetical protein